MAKKHTIEMMDQNFHEKIDHTTPFGGKVMVFEGCFRQVLPVVPNYDEQRRLIQVWWSHICGISRKVSFSIQYESKSWSKFYWLLIHFGNDEESTIEDNLTLMSQQMVAQASGDSQPEEWLIIKILPSLQQIDRSTKSITKKAILASKTEFVNNLIKCCLLIFQGN